MGLEYYAIGGYSVWKKKLLIKKNNLTFAESGADLYVTSAIHDSKNEIRALDTFISKEIENTLIEVRKALEVGITP